MEQLKDNRYLVKGNSYIIDLLNVDFITWKENEKVESSFWVKLHMGTKEARFVCDSLDDLRFLLECWTNLRGKILNLTDEELTEGEYKWD
jgi:hypothetical protein